MHRGSVTLAFALVLVGCSSPEQATTTLSAGAVSSTTTAPTAEKSETATSPPIATTEPTGNDFGDQRNAMVDTQIVSRLIENPAVVEAMRVVPRHEFVPDEYLDRAYNDHPLPIGYGQTISQPYIVALMTQALDLEAGDRILEIGTGSGYQAAVLAEMGMDVYSVEIIEELAVAADERLGRLGYNVAVLLSDGYFGWEEHAPFDVIIVTAAPDHLPQPLAAQLVVGGRMVIPIGPIGAVQTLWRFTRGEDGELTAENLGAVSFVPFTRDGG